MSKKSILIVIVVLAIIVISVALVNIAKNGFWYVGNVWWDTIEEALAHEADLTLDTEKTLSVKTLLHTTTIDDITIMTFVSHNDALTTVSFVSNEDGLYSVYGYTEELFLSSPSEFVITGEENQFILFPYRTYGDTVYGWCYSNVTPLVNGRSPSITTVEFECQENTWCLSFWIIDNINDIKNVDVTFDLN